MSDREPAPEFPASTTEGYDMSDEEPTADRLLPPLPGPGDLIIIRVLGQPDRHLIADEVRQTGECSVAITSIPDPTNEPML